MRDPHTVPVKLWLLLVQSAWIEVTSVMPHPLDHAQQNQACQAIKDFLGRFTSGGSPARETGSRLTLRDLSAASPVCMSSFHRRSQSATCYGTAGWVIGGVELCHKARIVCSPFYGSMSRVAILQQ
jgi:hypothetical protein